MCRSCSRRLQPDRWRGIDLRWGGLRTVERVDRVPLFFQEAATGSAEVDRRSSENGLLWGGWRGRRVAVVGEEIPSDA